MYGDDWGFSPLKSKLFGVRSSSMLAKSRAYLLGVYQESTVARNDYTSERLSLLECVCLKAVLLRIHQNPSLNLYIIPLEKRVHGCHSNANMNRYSREPDTLCSMVSFEISPH
ncbi:hypothetical protein CEXT_132311 [Caerostris extrusa]|uniref:Uncharacterized protein n=1 Tax=Caerostris extrusa TaxID=172846 RepID=A0AAV4R4A6_CAEEX|nr:hypothetical protein CEXT_132311 [Caerostris extrusa]